MSFFHDFGLFFFQNFTFGLFPWMYVSVPDIYKKNLLANCTATNN